MKRTAVVLGIAAAIFVAPQAANAGHVAQVNTQVVKQVVSTQRHSKMVIGKAVVAQRVEAQKRRAHRIFVMRALGR